MQRVSIAVQQRDGPSLMVDVKDSVVAAAAAAAAIDAAAVGDSE